MLRHHINYILLLAFLCSMIFSPLPATQAQEAPPDPRFGMVEAFWDTTAATESGVAWERILFTWSELQPNGPDDWNTLHVPDEWLQWAQAQGREVVGLLKNTPYWATDAAPPTEASPPRGLELPIDDPSNTWAAFVRRTVTFYAPRGVHRWIIWNEPDIAPGVYGQEWAGSLDEYYRLLKVAYLVIKKVDPTAHVHLAGLTFWHDRSWLGTFLAVATADPEGATHGYFFDVISLHIYFQTDSVDYIVNEARAALSAYGLNKPIWINETNASPDADPEWPVTRPRWRVDLREQASFILQAYALGLAAGVERIAVYKLIDVGLPPGGEPFGLLRPDHSRRPALTAYSLATCHYAGTQGGSISRQPGVTQVTLDQDDRTTRVFWARTAAEVTLTVPAFAPQASLIDQAGNVQALDGNSGNYTLTLPGARCADETLGCIIGGPTYLLVEEAAAGASVPSVAQATPVPESDPEAPTPIAESNSEVSTSTIEITPTLRPTLPGLLPPPTSTITPLATVTASATPSPLPSPSPTPLATATATLTPPPTASPSPTDTPVPPATATPVHVETPTSNTWQTAASGFLLVVLLLSLVIWYLRRARR